MARRRDNPSTPAISDLRKRAGQLGTSGVTSNVRNVSNTGQMSTSTQTTGATGAVRNTNNFTVTQGSPGASGTSSVSYTPPGSSNALSPQDLTPNITIPGITVTGGNVTVSPELGGSVDVGERVRGAFTEIEGRLAQERQRALGMVPEQFKGQVNTAFDTASANISEQRRRLGY